MGYQIQLSYSEDDETHIRDKPNFTQQCQLIGLMLIIINVLTTKEFRLSDFDSFPTFFSWTFSKQVSWRNRVLVVTDWTRRFIFGRDSSRIWGRQLTDNWVSNRKTRPKCCWPSFTFWYLRKILFSNLDWLTRFVE